MKGTASRILSLLLAVLTCSCSSRDCGEIAEDHFPGHYLSEFEFRNRIENMEIWPEQLGDPVQSPFSRKDVFPLMKYPLDDRRLLTAFIELEFKSQKGILKVEIFDCEVSRYVEPTIEFAFGGFLSIDLSGRIFSTTIMKDDFAQFTKYRVLDDSLFCISLAQFFE